MTPNLIAICGVAGSGKSTVQQYLSDYHGFRAHDFAMPLKTAAQLLTGMNPHRDPADPEARERRDPFWGRSPRQFLQDFGQGMRNLFGQDFWLKVWRQRYDALPPGSRVVVTDCRYENEVQFLRERGAVILGVERPGAAERLPPATLAHSSEQMALYKLRAVCDTVLVNDTTIFSLCFKVEMFLKEGR